MKGENFEKSVVEAILHTNSVYYELGLSKREFHEPTHRLVYTTIGEMLSKGLEVNIRTLFDYKPEISYEKLSRYDPTQSANAGYYARGLRARTQKNDLIALAKDLLEKAKTTRDVQDVIDFAHEELIQVGEDREASFQNAGDLVLPALEKLEQAYRNNGIEGLKTGYYEFDELAGGLKPGELVVIAARTSIGKTTLAVNMAYNMAKAGKKVAFFSCEMTSDEIMFRLFSSVSGVSHSRMAKGLMTKKDLMDLAAVGDTFREEADRIWIDDTPSIKWADLRNRARAMRVRGIDAVFIDYLTMIRFGHERTPRPERIGMLTQELKALARELKVPVIVMSQLNRESERREGSNTERKPSLGDLRQSGEIEENADVILLLDRDRYNLDTPTDVTVAKYRGGPTGHFELIFEPDCVRFVNAVKNP
jgi:replicative DNA helicase